MAIYSHSRIGSYETCPQKYKFQYVDQIKGDMVLGKGRRQYHFVNF